MVWGVNHEGNERIRADTRVLFTYCLRHLLLSWNTTTKATHLREGLFEAYSSREIRVHHLHGREVRLQAGIVAEAGS